MDVSECTKKICQLFERNLYIHIYKINGITYMYLGIHLPYVFESEQTIMCCFLRIHFSIPFSNRRFLTSDQVIIITQYLQATVANSQFRSLSNSRFNIHVSKRARLFSIKLHRVQLLFHQPTPKQATPKNSMDTHSIHDPYIQSYILHPWMEPLAVKYDRRIHRHQRFSSLSPSKTKSPLVFSKYHCLPRIYIPDSPCQAN